MVIENPDAMNVTANADGIGGANNMAHPSGIPQDQIDNIMSGIANTGDVKMNNHRKKLRQRFDIIKKLGQGTYGKVQLGINKETGQEVAIKTIKKCKIEAEADLVRIRREVQIMSSVQHPNIIHIYEVFENREKMVLVMEFAAGGELYDYLSERKVLTEEEARRIFRQVATAVYYCHKHKICHRDLKLENILLDEHGNAKIADFGLSNVFDDQRMLATFCGSPLYASPEIVEGTPYQGPEVDCWSLGVLLYTLVYGSMPFDGSNFKRLVKQISQGDYYEPKKPSRASTLIRDMLTVCPRKRATIEQICSHWWVNENDNVSCLDLAEDLANQTPVRLDVLLSLTPAAVTADQLVVPSADGNAVGKGGERVPRSHSVGSIRDMGGNTEAERRILDMVAAGGEAALMPSPTRTITPAQSPVQTKRKLETTVSSENTLVVQKKKEKPGGSALIIGEETTPIGDDIAMHTDDAVSGGGGIVEEPQTPAVTTANTSHTFSHKDMQRVDDLCEQLMQDNDHITSAATVTARPTAETTTMAVPQQKTVGKLDAVVEASEEKDIATKTTKKVASKQKTIDAAIVVGGARQAATSSNKSTHEQTPPSVQPAQTPPAVTTTVTSAAADKTSTPTITTTPGVAPFVRKCSLQDDAPLNKFNAERRKSRILETAEKFQQMTPGNGVDKPKKVSIPGVSVGSFKKEFERKASTTNVTPSRPTAGERRALEEVAAATAAASELENTPDNDTPPHTASLSGNEIEGSDSKNSVTSLSLDVARRSMENSIALLRQAQTESTQDVDQLCAQTEGIGVSDTPIEVAVDDRERKLKNARAIIGNAIQPGGGIGSGFGFGTGDTYSYSPGNGINGDGGGGGGGGGGGVGGDFGVGYGVSGGYRGVSFDSSKRYNNSINAAHPPATSTTPMHIQTASASSLRPQLVSAYASFPPPTTAATVAAIANDKAAARQTIMERLASATAGGESGSGRGGYSSGSGESSYGFNNLYASHAYMPSATSSTNTGSYHYRPQLQKQQSLPHQQHMQQQKLPQYVHQHQHQRHMSVGLPPTQSPSSLASAIIAAAATKNTKNANAVPITTINTNNNKITTTTNNNNGTIQNSVPKPFYNASMHHPSTTFLKSSPGDESAASGGNGTVKTSTASITLKSATLPRRKTAKAEIQLDIKPRIVEQPSMRFTTEMQHPIQDLRSAPAREGPLPYSPIKTTLNARASSLEPKEHIIPIQRQQPPYTRTTSNKANRSGSLSRQSTVDSESDTTTNLSQSTLTGSSQPIKKSPREFIIPIAMEGGGFITPREGSIEPSDSSHTTASSRNTFTRLRPTRRIGSLLSEASIDENLPFEKIRTASVNRDGDEDSRFTLHKLRSSRPVKKVSQDNDSQSSGEEDDDDGFEILTAENLFSTLLQRVRALTNRMNVNNDLTAGFPSSTRLLGNMRQAQSPFWNQEHFGSRLNGAPWRHSMSRDLGNDMESMFSRTGATLPRGNKADRSHQLRQQQQRNANASFDINGDAGTPISDLNDLTVDINDLTAASAAGAGQQRTDENTTPLDLADLDLSRLRLSKKDLETLSNIAPGLPKCFQEQLLAKLPPTQARKLSRTLSMQNSPHITTVKVYKRSQSSGRGALSDAAAGCDTTATTTTTTSLNPPPTLDEEPPKETESPSSAIRSQLYRRSLSRSRNEPVQQQSETTATSTTSSAETAKSRSNNVHRDGHSKPLVCSAYTSADMVADKYRYQSPYLCRSLADGSDAVSPQRRYYGGASSASSVTLTRDVGAAGRPPSGCLSPDTGASSCLRRPGSQRRISRFLRPDFFDEPPPTDENGPLSAYNRDKKPRDRDTQSLLREIREKSRESSIEPYCDGPESIESSADTLRRKYQLPQQRSANDSKTIEPLEGATAAGHEQSGHVRNHSLDAYDQQQEAASLRQQQRRSLSRPREICEELDKHVLADKILQELQLLSAVRSQQEQRLAAQEATVDTPLLPIAPGSAMSNAGDGVDEANVYKEKTSTIKKVKKVKPKTATTAAADLPPGEGYIAVDGGDVKMITSSTSTVVKKVKKIVKKSNDEAGAAPTLATPEDMTLSPVCDGVEVPKKESRLKRPKSYPTKELTPTTASSPVTASSTSGAAASIIKSSELSNALLNCQAPLVAVEGSREELDTIGDLTTVTATDATIATKNATTTTGAPRESRLVRPKSYPASKLKPVKAESKQATRSGIAIPTTIADVDVTKNDINAPNSETVPTTVIKKITKKKSKLIQPTSLTPTSPSISGVQMPTAADTRSREWSPVLKEKSPEKKTGKGLLYAIGQKFEKLRDSAKKSSSNSGGAINASAIGGAFGKKHSPESCSPEKIKEKGASTLLGRKKSLKTEKGANTSGSMAASGGSKEASKIANGNIDTASQTLEKPTKVDKRSRIDAMIRSLRERSVPRCHTTSESNYLKRAVSVEDMPGTFNRNAVNKVLGLFRRFERDGDDRRVRNTRSTSNIERQMRDDDDSPCRSSAPIYQNAIMEARNGKSSEKQTKGTAATCKTKTTKKSHTSDSYGVSCDEPPPSHSSPNTSNSSTNCPDCQQQQTAQAAAKAITVSNSSQMAMATGNKDKRKGLMLDLDGKAGSGGGVGVGVGAHSKAGNYMAISGNGIYSNLPPYPGAIGKATAIDNATTDNNNSSSTSANSISTTTATTNNNNNTNNSNNNNSLHLSLNTNTSNNSTTINNNNNNNTNNNTSSSQTSGYRTSSAHEINRNHLLTPSTENMANYSSDSRSCQDDCASTSTFLSPTEEPELCFDNWSICSEDNYMLHATPSPTVSHLSRTSQHSPSHCDSSDPNESVIERIKRRSFYCRFNDKKPRRTSSIVGPTAVRDYYREQQQHRAAAAATIAAAVSKTRSSHRLAGSSGGGGGTGGVGGKRATSPDITHEFFRPLKLSPVGTELKPPVYRSPHDYCSSSSVSVAASSSAAAASAVAATASSATSMRNSRKSLTDIRATPISTSSSFRRYGVGITTAQRDDYLSGGVGAARYKSSSSNSNSPYESNGDSATTLGASSSGYYSTYNPKRRSSYTLLNGSVGDTKPHNVTNSTIDSYATFGRRSTRAYDQRTRSLLDPHTIATAASGGGSSSSASTYLPRRDTRTPVRDYTTSTSRLANTRDRTSSMSRSPTNI